MGREEIAKATVRYADFVSWEPALQFSYGIGSETEEFWADHNKSPSLMVHASHQIFGGTNRYWGESEAFGWAEVTYVRNEELSHKKPRAVIYRTALIIFRNWPGGRSRVTWVQE